MRELHALLRLAYSAERAAELAYRGHAASVRAPEERRGILVIAEEEVAHRAHAARMMAAVGIGPSRWLELKYAVIGRGIGLSCHVIGWFMPMYFAGRLEGGNVGEYLRLAELVAGTPLAGETACIMDMAAVELRHELWFMERIQDHPWTPLFARCFGWARERGRRARFEP